MFQQQCMTHIDETLMNRPELPQKYMTVKEKMKLKTIFPNMVSVVLVFIFKFVFYTLFDATKRGWSIMIDSWTLCMLAFEQAFVKREIPQYLGFTAWWLLLKTTTSPVQDGITHIWNFFGLIFVPFGESGDTSLTFICVISVLLVGWYSYILTQRCIVTLVMYWHLSQAAGTLFYPLHITLGARRRTEHTALRHGTSNAGLHSAAVLSAFV